MNKKVSTVYPLKREGHRAGGGDHIVREQLQFLSVEGSSIRYTNRRISVYLQSGNLLTEKRITGFFIIEILGRESKVRFQ